MEVLFTEVEHIRESDAQDVRVMSGLAYLEVHQLQVGFHRKQTLRWDSACRMFTGSTLSINILRREENGQRSQHVMQVQQKPCTTPGELWTSNGPSEYSKLGPDGLAFDRPAFLSLNMGPIAAKSVAEGWGKTWGNQSLTEEATGSLSQCLPQAITEIKHCSIVHSNLNCPFNLPSTLLPYSCTQDYIMI